MTKLFDCPFCNHRGSDGWIHLKTKHPDKADHWEDALNSKQEDQITEDEMPKEVDVKCAKYSITRRLEFDAGHRVHKHESKCNSIHGHRYVVEVTCCGPLDSIGRVIDFSVIKSICGQWLDDNLDHAMILYDQDPLVDVWKQMNDLNGHFGNQKYYLMTKNPTAENIAEHLFIRFNEFLKSHGIVVMCVTVHETPNCMAKFGI